MTSRENDLLVRVASILFVSIHRIYLMAFCIKQQGGEFGFYAADHLGPDLGQSESRKKSGNCWYDRTMSSFRFTSKTKQPLSLSFTIKSTVTCISVNLCDRSYNGGLGNFVNISTYRQS